LEPAAEVVSLPLQVLEVQMAVVVVDVQIQVTREAQVVVVL
jgi:hypothetical protein